MEGEAKTIYEVSIYGLDGLLSNKTILRHLEKLGKIKYISIIENAESMQWVTKDAKLELEGPKSKISKLEASDFQIGHAQVEVVMIEKIESDVCEKQKFLESHLEAKSTGLPLESLCNETSQQELNKLLFGAKKPSPKAAKETQQQKYPEMPSIDCQNSLKPQSLEDFDNTMSFQDKHSKYEFLRASKKHIKCREENYRFNTEVSIKSCSGYFRIVSPFGTVMSNCSIVSRSTEWLYSTTFIKTSKTKQRRKMYFKGRLDKRFKKQMLQNQFDPVNEEESEIFQHIFENSGLNRFSE